ncbi:Os11g0205900 [Oryza sativa Japonica Group]|uniref:Os11g0205900 protein n=1 Tax=Oryza sativa subsp. japonica TaxID=39947 RepID=A0A0P0XZS7_ORYSJ|nr:Os11g0205900 [Oryza sativa Japonica Group]
MSPRKKAKESPGSTGGDRIGDLPDEVLHHVLSFLPAQEAVRTCLLARRWRHLWKSATGVRIGEGETDPGSVKDHQEFLDHLLVLRDSVPMETCVLRFSEHSKELIEDAARLNFWFKHALLRKVRFLQLENWEFYDPVPIDELPLVSRHLTRLQLYGISLNDSFLNFSSCPALEHLLFEFCFFECAKISSNSVKRLSITCCSFNATLRVRVDVPSLVSLRLDEFDNRAPVLERMPSLVDAFGPEHIMKINGNCSSVDRSAAISAHLEIVEIRFFNFEEIGIFDDDEDEDEDRDGDDDEDSYEDDDDKDEDEDSYEDDDDEDEDEDSYEEGNEDDNEDA